MPLHMKPTQVNLLQSLESAGLLGDFKSQRFRRKNIIFTPFDGCNNLFMIRSGRIRVYLSYQDKEFTLAILEPGDVFSTHTRAFMQAMEETEILSTTTSAFQQKIGVLPEFSLVMVKVLGDLLKNSISIIEGLAFKEVRQRLADFLVQAVTDRGRPEPGGVLVELGLGTEDIALLVGTTRQSISQFLNELIKEGIIEKPSRRTLLVRKPEELAAWRDSP
jgi:CRP/FNR family transcriptional regulator, carbon monoxide oxidation system transcription regulator